MAKTFTLEEIKKHTTDQSMWLLVGGRVYDVTAYKDDHPGGDLVFRQNCGRDATKEWEEVGHTPGAEKLMSQYHIGNLEGATLRKMKTPETVSEVTPRGLPKQGSNTWGMIPFLIVVILSIYARFFK